jgi:hypothetical protein
MAKITITIWDERDDLAVCAVDFDPPINAEKGLSQAQEVASRALDVIQEPMEGSKIEGVWTDRDGWHGTD